MKEPLWIDERDALALHHRLLALYGGAAGLRDDALLKSALARPQQHYAYGESPDIIDMATAYTAGIVRNHPFLDGKQAHWLCGGRPVSRTQRLSFHRQRGKRGAGGFGAGGRKPR